MEYVINSISSKCFSISFLYSYFFSCRKKLVIYGMPSTYLDRWTLTGKIGNIQLKSISPVTVKAFEKGGNKLTRTTEKTLD